MTDAGGSVLPRRARMAAASAVLEANRRARHTVPAAGLYPHQWSWDSAFIAMGLAHTDPQRAALELQTLLAAQWADGRIPQIVFDPDRSDGYEPGAAFWNSAGIPSAPTGPGAPVTSGFVQPPVHAWAAWRIHRVDPAASRAGAFLERVYPALRAWHHYLRTHRTRGGAAWITHPWESGVDDSPLWDPALAAVPETVRWPISRPDLVHVGPGERPGRRAYQRFFHLAECYRDHACDDADPRHPFLVEDPGFTALFALAEQALARIAAELGDSSAPHEAAAARLTASLGSLYDPERGCFLARDLHGSLPNRVATVGGLLAVLSPGPHRETLLQTILGPGFLGAGAALVPSLDARAPEFEPARYWRGPAWFNMNWMLVLALADLGHREASDRLGATLCAAACAGEYPEYVDAWTLRPYGTRRFSWTAALALELDASDERWIL